MGTSKLESIRTLIHFIIYITIFCWVISRIIESYRWLEKGEIGTIYKVDVPGFIIYPTITICPFPSKRTISAKHSVNASWDVPKPNMTNILTYLEYSYYKNDRYVDQHFLLILLLEVNCQY